MWQRHVTMNRIAKAHVKSYRVYCVESDSTDDDTGHGGRKGSLYFGNTLLTETYGSNSNFSSCLQKNYGFATRPAPCDFTLIGQRYYFRCLKCFIFNRQSNRLLNAVVPLGVATRRSLKAGSHVRRKHKRKRKHKHKRKKTYV